MGLAEILRALLLSDHAKLRDPEWVARAVAAVDDHEARAAAAAGPEPGPVTM
jgi:hypothetical protein